MEQFNEDKYPFCNPNLLRIGGIAALGGLLIYTIIGWITLTVFHYYLIRHC
jgi:hypothetical protein